MSTYFEVMVVIVVLVYSAEGRIKKLKGSFAPSSLTLCQFHMWLLLPSSPYIAIDWQEWLCHNQYYNQSILFLVHAHVV